MSDAGRAAVIGLVQAVVPASEPGKGFTFTATGGGGALPLSARRHILRASELQDTSEGPGQGEIASASPRHWEERWYLVVNYPAGWGKDTERLKRLMRADMRAVIAALQPQAGWLASLYNLHVGHERWGITDINNDDGEVIAYEAALPIDVEYFATP